MKKRTRLAVTGSSVLLAVGSMYAVASAAGGSGAGGGDPDTPGDTSEVEEWAPDIPGPNDTVLATNGKGLKVEFTVEEYEAEMAANAADYVQRGDDLVPMTGLLDDGTLGVIGECKVVTEPNGEHQKAYEHALDLAPEGVDSAATTDFLECSPAPGVSWAESQGPGWEFERD